MYPKSPYYRFYIQQLNKFGPTPRERADRITKKERKIMIKAEGTVETVSVGAMSEIVREEFRQVLTT